MIAAPPPPPLVRCASHQVSAHFSHTGGAVGVTWRLDRFVVARLRPFQGVAFRPGIAGPGRHALRATFVFTDRPPITITVVRWTFCR